MENKKPKINGQIRREKVNNFLHFGFGLRSLIFDI
jgi:hypothetical protein